MDKYTMFAHSAQNFDYERVHESFIAVNKSGIAVEYEDPVRALIAQLEALDTADSLADWADYLEREGVTNERQARVIADVFVEIGAAQARALVTLISQVEARQ